MGKIVEKKQKKKKGRPSLLDLQKRNLIEQQQQQQQQKNRNPNPNSNPNFRDNRSTRRNPNLDGISSAAESLVGSEEEEDNEVVQDDYNDDDDDDDDERREKKLKFVLRLPPNQKSSSVSPCSYLNGDYAEDGDSEMPHKKQKINVVADGSAAYDIDQKGGKHNSNSKAIDAHLGTPFVFGPTTPIPDKQLLVFILDRLQKKDTYSVFSEPVDPEELPDYHDIIKRPMDFGTVRKKLDAGAYANLEEFEEDVFLICSNAMKYNAPDTIYFRQARSIQELAKKNFENLRQDGDDVVREPKRRGRPPKHLKKPLGRPPLERAGSDFSSDAALATGVEKNGYNLRKAHVSDKSSLADASGRTRYTESSWLGEHKSEKNEEFSGSTFKGTSTKYGKKLCDVDDTRRDTYKHYHPSGGGCEPSVLTTFDSEKKQLLAVGLHTEHGYARSLARFAANLGPVAWKVAARKIAKSLPAGTMFGPGWVGENEVPAIQPQFLGPSPPQPGQPQQSIPLPSNSQSSFTPEIFESDGNKVLLKDDFPESNVPYVHLNRTLHPSDAASSSTAPETNTEHLTARGVNSQSGLGVTNNSLSGIRPPFQIHQNPAMNPPLNGFNGAFASPMGKLVRPSWQSGSFNSDASVHPRMLEVGSGNNNFTSPTNHLQSEKQAVSGGAGFHYPQSTWRPSAHPQKPNSVPPDLNVRFQLPGSPNPGGRVDSPQPDLALQL